MSESRYDPERGITWLKVRDAPDSQHVIVRLPDSSAEGSVPREMWVQWRQPRDLTLRAENERLRSALATIAAGALPGSHPPSYCVRTLNAVVQIARDALSDGAREVTDAS